MFGIRSSSKRPANTVVADIAILLFLIHENLMAVNALCTISVLVGCDIRISKCAIVNAVLLLDAAMHCFAPYNQWVCNFRCLLVYVLRCISLLPS